MLYINVYCLLLYWSSCTTPGQKALYFSMAAFSAFKLVMISISFTLGTWKRKTKWSWSAYKVVCLFKENKKSGTFTSFSCHPHHPLPFFTPPDALPDFQLGIANSSLVLYTGMLKAKLNKYCIIAWDQKQEIWENYQILHDFWLKFCIGKELDFPKCKLEFWYGKQSIVQVQYKNENHM